MPWSPPPHRLPPSLQWPNQLSRGDCSARLRARACRRRKQARGWPKRRRQQRGHREVLDEAAEPRFGGEAGTRSRGRWRQRGRERRRDGQGAEKGEDQLRGLSFCRTAEPRSWLQQGRWIKPQAEDLLVITSVQNQHLQFRNYRASPVHFLLRLVRGATVGFIFGWKTKNNAWEVEAWDEIFYFVSLVSLQHSFRSEVRSLSSETSSSV